MLSGHGEDLDFGDLFAADPASRDRLEQIAATVRPNDSAPMIDFSLDADPDQEAFIASEAATIRLLAPAGSGKTQSIANRILRRVAGGRPPGQFLVLTFDNAAALSLRERLGRGMAAAGMAGATQVFTLNAFGYGLFRTVLSEPCGRYALGADPTADQREAVRRGLEDLRHRRPAVAALLPRHLSFRVYLDLFAALKNHLIVPDAFAGAGAPRAVAEFLDLAARRRLLEPWLAAVAGLPAETAARQDVVNALVFLYRTYCAVLVANRRIDFDDQKLFPYVALARDPALLAAAMAPYRCVIVDEFQDINRLDFELIRLLARDRQLVVVGDDDQAIYGFRGCSPDYIIDFAAHAGRGVETHVLRTNYRCPRNLVAMAARLIGHNTRRVPKESLPGRADEADVRVWHCVNAGSEAQILARFIRRLHAEHAGRGFRFADVAILTRMNSQSLPLQIALILEGIPYHCRREENVLLSETMGQLLGLIGLHLRLRAAPGYHAPEATRLLCRCFFRYQPPEAVEAFDRLVTERGGYPAATRWADRALEFRPPVTAHDLARAVAALASEATPALLVERIGACFKYLGGLVGSLDEALDNALPLGELVDIAGRFQGDVAQFHALLGGLLERVRGGLFVEREGEADAVNLLTYFRAKGRQWHTVLVPGANQKVIPHARADLEDERRLFYVATTRATANLVFSYVRQAVRSKVEPSQFLAELGLGQGEEKRATFLS